MESSSPAQTDRLVVDEFNQNMNDKENIPEQKTNPDSPDLDREKLISSIINADKHLHIRPAHVRKLSKSFDDIALMTIREE